ncbi:MAG: sugar kinase [Ruminococcaceae bacterium]|nr:sugar kinase [Oscillospiraceae bacterium]
MIWTMGEIIVEIMRNTENAPLDRPGVFLGPFPSGAPAIFADTVARMGHRAGIIGGVGNDDFGKCLMERLEKDGVDCSHIMRTEAASTGCAFVTYFDDGSRKFIYHIGDSAAGMAKCPDEESIPEASYFHVMGCSLMSNAAFGNEIIKSMRLFKCKGAKVSFDPNIRPELLGNVQLTKEVMSVANVLLPGVSELLTISGKDTVADAVKACFENENLEIIALKNGAKGCKIFTRDDYFEMGTYQVEAVDATGAGDSFDAAFLCGLCDGKTIVESAGQASAAAALNTAAFGPMEGKISIEAVKEIMRTGEK